MDTATTIVVTVLANAIVTGVVVFLFQKRTENSFARKLEEFKSRLQYSNFEQQTRFTASHARRVETLEILYRKFAAYSDALKHLISIITGEAVSTGENEWDQRLDKVRQLLKDFGNY